MKVTVYCYFIVLINFAVGNEDAEDCPYKGGSYMCGNVCTSESVPCISGNVTLSYQQLRHKCCVPLDELCYVVFNIDFDGE